MNAFPVDKNEIKFKTMSGPWSQRSMVNSEKKAHVLVCDEFGGQLTALLVCIGGHWGTKMAVWCQHGKTSAAWKEPGLIPKAL